MLEVILLVISSICILFLASSNFKLRQKVNKYEFDIFMQNVDMELECYTRDDPTIVDRILQ